MTHPSALLPTFRFRTISPHSEAFRSLWSGFAALDEALSDLDDVPTFRKARDGVSYTLNVPLAGYKRDQVTVEVLDGVLTVATQGHDSSLAYYLPKDADPTKVEAKMEDGLLLVTVQKVIAPKPRKVEVN